MVRAAVSEAPAGIAGGFVLVPVPALLAAWHACRARPLGVGAFRAWLAAHEMVARRRARGEGREANYGHLELARLLGVAEKRARAMIRRLEAAGLIRWSGTTVAFSEPPEARDLDAIGRGRGSLAIPRRILRFLCAGAKPALLATALATLLRCLSRRRSGWDGRGRLKASWVARTFQISTRQVQLARRELVGLGWVAPEPADQWALNRWGRAYRIDLDWSAPRRPGARSSYPGPDPGERSSQPCLHPEPLPEREEDQDPSPVGPSGARMGRDGGGGGEGTRRARATCPGGAIPSPLEPSPATREKIPRLSPAVATSPMARPMMAPAGQPEAGPPPARLADIRPEDLVDAGRLLELHGQAVAKGLASPSEDGRLKFLAIAEHARARGTVNPCGLLARLVSRGWWHFATQGEEDAARARLRGHLQGEPGRGARPWAMGPASSPGPGMSADARLVGEVRSATIRAGVFKDPWPAFRSRVPGWDRSRWDAALAELGLC